MIEVNFLAILVAAIVAMVVGFVWYSPLLFGTAWMKMMGYTKQSLEKDKQKMSKGYTLSFILSLVTAYVLSHVATMSAAFYGYTFMSSALTSAFYMWLGFVMPVQSTMVIFGKHPWKLFFINTGHQLTALLAMAVVLGVMG